MSVSHALRELAAIASSVTSSAYALDVIFELADRTHSAVGAGATGVLVDSPRSGLALLAASSQGSAEIEMYQALVGDGPCLEALRTNQIVISTHPADLVGRWPSAGPVIVGAGFHSTLSVPIRWRSATFGALNSFFPGAQTFTTDQVAIATIAAELAALALVHAPHEPNSDAVTGTVEAALEERATVERASMAVAGNARTSSSERLEALRAAAASRGQTLSEYAHAVLTRVGRGENWDGG